MPEDGATQYFKCEGYGPEWIQGAKVVMRLADIFFSGCNFFIEVKTDIEPYRLSPELPGEQFVVLFKVQEGLN